MQDDAKDFFDLESPDVAALERLKTFIEGLTRHIQQAAVDYFEKQDESSTVVSLSDVNLLKLKALSRVFGKLLKIS